MLYKMKIRFLLDSIPQAKADRAVRSHRGIISGTSHHIRHLEHIIHRKLLDLDWSIMQILENILLFSHFSFYETKEGWFSLLDV